MIDLTDPIYQKLFIDLAYLRFENIDNEKRVITVKGVNYDMTNPEIALIVDRAGYASKEMYDVLTTHYNELFESNRGEVH